jgi:glycosyltransferase involved in cell wall biosynthesis
MAQTRLTLPPLVTGRRQSNPERPRVLYVYGALEGLTATTRYRALNMCEFLRERGIDAQAVGDNHLRRRPEWMLSFDVMVIVRIPLYPALRDFIQAARQRGAPVLYDVDDLIWDGALLDSMDLPPEDKQHYRSHAERYHRAIDVCDSVVVPTEYLADQVAKLGKPVSVVRNGVSRLQIRLSTEAMARRRPSDAPAIGYFGGSATHRRDFQTAAPALRQLLEEFPRMRLLVGGYVDLPRELAAFKGRVARAPWVRWERLPGQLALANVNIAPLEVGNPFCEGKSELKYFEAGLLAIPTVASATDTFRRAIAPGQNGYVAATEQDWYESLRLLIEQPALRARMGNRAREHVLGGYAAGPIGEAAFGVVQRALGAAETSRVPPAVTA